MLHTRYHPITNIPILYAADRAKRPHQFEPENVMSSDHKDCPLCEGNEPMTPNEVFVIGGKNRSPNSTNWSVRVIPNKFPALSNEHYKLLKEKHSFQCEPSYGYHEVIVSNDHDKPLALLTPTELYNNLLAYQNRITTHKKDTHIKHVQIIHNHGKKAGASLPHPHSQVLSNTFIPPKIQTLIAADKSHRKNHSQGIIKHLIQTEKRKKDRIVAESDHFISWCPYASMVPYEIWIAPKKEHHYFEDTPEKALKEFSKLFKTMLLKLYKKVNNPDLNFYLISSPQGEKNKVHWHIQIIPRTFTWAGYEFATGACINSMLPEMAAKILR